MMSVQGLETLSKLRLPEIMQAKLFLERSLLTELCVVRYLRHNAERTEELEGRTPDASLV